MFTEQAQLERQEFCLHLARRYVSEGLNFGRSLQEMHADLDTAFGQWFDDSADAQLATPVVAVRSHERLV